MPPSFSQICKLFQDKGCTLLETEEEYNQIILNNPCNYKVRYNALCTHDHIVFVNVFKSRGTGIICPSCKHKENGFLQKQQNNIANNGSTIKILQEDECIDFITKNLNDDFDVVKTSEGCLCDMAIKPKSVQDDKWLMIQVKTTKKPNNGYSFHCKNSYKDMVMLFMCLDERKIWIMNGNEIQNTKKLTIGQFSSKYDQCFVKVSELKITLSKCYSKLKLQSINVINIPISLCQQREHEFRLYRERMCSFLTFTQPNRNQVCYDFLINNKKIQEKVGTIHKGKKTIAFYLYRRNGITDNLREYRLYQEGDNDFYWLHFPDKTTFYVIPENVLKEHGYISKTDEIICTRKILLLNPCKSNINASWCNDFAFVYNNIDVLRLTALFD